MKTTCKITAVLFFVLTLGTGITVQAEEKTKEYHEKWPASGVETIDISNKFGEVRFTNEAGPDITIDVVVTVEGSNDKKTSEMLDKISVSFSKSGSTVKAETSISSNYNFNGKMSIDYVINTPTDKNLVVSNKYGNTVLNKLTGTGNFNIQYGNINAVSLTGTSTKLELAYGKGNIEETANINIDISYSKITLGTINDLLLESKYSEVEFDKGHLIQIESKYDKLNFGRVKSVTANTKYSQLKIDYLAAILKIETGYGGIRVNEIDPGFESVSITNSYGQISLGLNNASYTVDAKCDYCGISYPQEKFKGNRMKENTSYELNGKIGTAGGGSVMIRSRYGEIKLGE